MSFVAILQINAFRSSVKFVMVFPRTLCLYSIIRGHQWHCFERINNKYKTTFYLFIRKRCLFIVLFLVSKSLNLKIIRLLFYLEYFDGLLEISANSICNVPIESKSGLKEYNLSVIVRRCAQLDQPYFIVMRICRDRVMVLDAFIDTI